MNFVQVHLVDFAYELKILIMRDTGPFFQSRLISLFKLLLTKRISLEEYCSFSSPTEKCVRYV